MTLLLAVIALSCFVLTTEPMVCAQPVISFFDRTGSILWSNVVPGHAYNVVRTPAITGNWSTVVSNVRPTNVIAQAHVELGGDAGFLRVAHTGVYASPQTSTDLGSVSGDTGSDQRGSTNFGDAFFVVLVTENDSSFPGESLSLGLTLTSPAQMDYDLYVSYAGSLLGSSTNHAGQADVINLSWNDTLGQDDSRSLLVEVRRYAGIVFTPWTLLIEGNTP